MVTILQKEHKTLRKIAEPVKPADIASPKIKKTLDSMRIALDARKDGVAIAAPQIGISLRIFLVSPRAFESAGSHRRRSDGKEDAKKDIPLHRTFINPHIIKASKERVWLEEGCLSVESVFGRSHRARKVSVRALDENSKTFTMTGNTLLSQIFQHEIDHLDGTRSEERRV